MDTISVRGARTHNLANIDLEIPRDRLIVITGLSGSGKSSLAFDTLYAEGQRRYVESLSAYARQFLSMMEKPDVDHIEGLSPAISIEQKSTSHNPRSTVGTITEIYDYLRLLYARVGEPRCPHHGEPLDAQTVSQMVDQVLELPENRRIMILAPVIVDRKGEHLHVFKELLAGGFIRARIDGLVVDLDHPPELDKNRKHTIEAVIDRLRVRGNMQQRLAESFETALQLSDGIARVADMDEQQAGELVFSARFACPVCGYSISELEPRKFSFNNPAGACSECDGLGVKQFFDPDLVVRDPDMTLADGAIRGWDRRNVYYFHMLNSLSGHYGFDVEAPYASLKKKHREAILYGSGRERIDFSYVNDRGDVITRRHRFEGVIPNMERRYHETDSSMVRENLQNYLRVRACPECNGTRLCEESRNVFIGRTSLPEVTGRSVEGALGHFEKLNLTGQRGAIAEKILKEIRARLRFLVDVGLNYLTLDRSAETLSGGEAQRIRLASQIGAGLVGVMYILDEPVHRPAPTGQRPPAQHPHPPEGSGQYRAGGGTRRGSHPHRRPHYRYRPGRGGARRPDRCERQPRPHIGGAGLHYRAIPVRPEVDSRANSAHLGRQERRGAAEGSHGKQSPGHHRGHSLRPVHLHHRCFRVRKIHADQPDPLSGHRAGTEQGNLADPVTASWSRGPRTPRQGGGYRPEPHRPHPRSNPATYTGLFTPIRELFAQTRESRARGYKPGRFSFNVKGGRCEACQGDGMLKVEMHFLPDIYVPCDVCKGKRYNRETLEVRYKHRNIHQVLDMTVEEARDFFDAVPVLSRKLQTLVDVGLSYIKLGQSATTLSGGEAQRVKLSRELSKRDTGKTLYILDEPTTGLHFQDIAQLLDVLHRLRDHGNTVVVIEHNLDVIKTADWIIDLGPEGGSGGGQIVAVGTPEEIAEQKDSHTGQFLKRILGAAQRRVA